MKDGCNGNVTLPLVTRSRSTFEENVQLLFIFLMAYTVLLVVVGIRSTPYEYYPNDVVGEKTSSTTLIQIDVSRDDWSFIFL